MPFIIRNLRAFPASSNTLARSWQEQPESPRRPAKSAVCRTALIAGLAIVPALPGQAQKLGSSRPSMSITSMGWNAEFLAATTVRVTIRREYGRQDGAVVQETLHVEFARPDRVRISAEYTAPSKETQLYVADGKTQHDFSSRHNQYRSSPYPDSDFQSVPRIVSMVDTLLSRPDSPPVKGVVRTVVADVLDGRPMRLRIDRHPESGQEDGSGETVSEKLWVDQATGMPYRTARTTTINGVEKELVHAVYAGWALNKSMPDGRFAWVPPPGSTERTEPKLLAVGTQAPDFDAIAPTGASVKLSDMRGKVVVLDFWATWCGPCQQSMPHLEKVYQLSRQGDTDVAILALCVLDQKTAYDNWVRANGAVKYHFSTAFDAAGSSQRSVAAGLYGVAGIPTQYVIDRQGHIAAVLVGYDGEGDHRLEETLRRLGCRMPNADGNGLSADDSHSDQRADTSPP